MIKGEIEMKKLIAVMLAMTLTFTAVPSVVFASESKENKNVSTGQERKGTIGLNVQRRTQDEIRAFMVKHPASLQQEVTYRVQPSLQEPYSAGVLSNETLQSALNMVNQIRYIAGLDANVTLNSEYSELCSAGTLLNSLNRTLSHFPSRPAALADSKYDNLYAMGYEGCSSSNLGMGYSNINTSIIDGYMADDDSSNIDRVGHRRWILNPRMGSIGFGATGRWYALYAFDRTAPGGQTYVAWPAQVMPIQYFKSYYPWSVSTGHYVDGEAVTVTMTRRSDNKKWTFSADSAEGAFYVDNGGYGQTGCIIWRPDTLDSIAIGDVFDIKIVEEGYDTVAYTVSFLDCENGMIRAKDGWCYYKNGVLDTSYTGMAKNEYGWWYIKNGKLDNTYTGMAKNQYGWWYMKNGKLDTTYTGMAKNQYGWWYMKNGKLDTTYTGMAKNQYGWWYMKNGKLDTTYTGMAKNQYGWWYMKNGKLDTSYTGIAENEYGKWYMKNGKLDNAYNGTITLKGVKYTIKNGKVIK